MEHRAKWGADENNAVFPEGGTENQYRSQVKELQFQHRATSWQCVLHDATTDTSGGTLLGYFMPIN